jgi:hypothetical protein
MVAILQTIKCHIQMAAVKTGIYPGYDGSLSSLVRLHLDKASGRLRKIPFL